MKPSLCTSRIYYCLSLWQVGEVSLLKKIDPHFMNMMKNANNTTKTKLLTLVSKELRDGNENTAITNHFSSPRLRGAGIRGLLGSPRTPLDVGWAGEWGGAGTFSPPGPFPILHALEEERGEKRKASKVLNPTRISLLEGCPSSLRACVQRESGLVAKAQD